MTAIQLSCAVLAFAGFGAMAVTVMGYVDEGNHKRYDGFFDYLYNEGYPPTLDYVFWIALSIVLGFIALLVLEKNSQLESISAWWKIGISVLVIPFVFAVVMMAFIGIFSIVNQG